MKIFFSSTLNRMTKGFGILFFLLVGSGQASAATMQESFAQIASSDMFLWIILSAVVLLNIMALILLFVVLKVQQLLIGKADEAAGVAAEERESVWDSWQKKLTDAVPVEREKDVMLDHDYDGIHELDNNLPPWWTGLFYITIVFSVVYLAVYHVFDVMPLSTEEYNQEIAQAEVEVAEYLAQKANSIDESSVVLATDASALEQGETIYQQNCAQCHGKLGEGGIGPNMTDDYWLHGGSVQDVFKTVKYGVPAKGMIPWESQLTPAQMQAVSSFILTNLVGTNPPNAKKAEGELHVPEDGGTEEAKAGTSGDNPQDLVSN